MIDGSTFAFYGLVPLGAFFLVYFFPGYLGDVTGFVRGREAPSADTRSGFATGVVLIVIGLLAHYGS